MSPGLVAGCGALGLLAGAGLPVVGERVPRREPVLAGPFPEPAAALGRPGGWLLAGGTGALCGATGAAIGWTWALPAYLLLAVALVALSVIDLRHFLLPNRIVFPLAGASVVLLLLAALAGDDWGDLGRALLAGAAAFAAFAALHLAAPSAMGFGDVKLSFVLGLFLGWLGWGKVALGLFLGFAYGALVGIALMLVGARGRKDHVPFGPFLAAGTMTAILWGGAILDWYAGS